MRTPHISFSDGLIGPRTRVRPRAAPTPRPRASSARAASASAASKNPNIATLSRVRLLMQPIVDRGDPADDAIAAPREHQLDRGVREERILLRVEALVLADAQRRHPVRIARVALVHVVDEPADLGAAVDWANLQHGVLP